MKISLDRYNALAAAGAIRQGEWGDGREQACLMSALVMGATSADDCTARGWPLWLAEISVWLFDGYPVDTAVQRGRALAEAIADADRRGINWDDVFARVRLDAILPIAMEAIGDGDEPWRTACRDVIQWSIDHDGRPAEKAWAAWAADAAWAAEAADAAGAAWAAGAAEAAWAAEAAGAAWAADAAGAAALDRIEAALLAAIAEA